MPLPEVEGEYPLFEREPKLEAWAASPGSPSPPTSPGSVHEAVDWAAPAAPPGELPVLAASPTFPTLPVVPVLPLPPSPPFPAVPPRSQTTGSPPKTAVPSPPSQTASLPSLPLLLAGRIAALGVAPFSPGAPFDEAMTLSDKSSAPPSRTKIPIEELPGLASEASRAATLTPYMVLAPSTVTTGVATALPLERRGTIPRAANVQF